MKVTQKVSTEASSPQLLFSNSALHERKSLVERIKLSFRMGLGDFNLEMDDQAENAIQLLGLTKHELFKLKLKFKTFDKDASGELDYDEFLEMIKSPSNMLAVSLFKLIDVDGSGTIDFSEFIRVLSTYCLFSKEDILRFTFDCFDTDGSGTLDERELSEMCIAINSATPIFPGNFKKALKEFDTSGDGLIDFYEFKRLSERYPMLTYTAFQLQHKMQEKTLGVSTWTDILKHRNRSQFIEVYKEAHQGALPTETFCEKIVRFFWGSRTVRE